jgi:hypothetical protein
LRALSGDGRSESELFAAHGTGPEDVCVNPSFDQSILDATAIKPMFPGSMPPMDSLASQQPAPANPVDLMNKYGSMGIDQMIEQEICSMVRGRKRSSMTHREQFRLVWNKCWEHMKQVYDDTGKESWQSKTFQPDTPKVVETIVANLHSALLSPNMPAEWQCKIKEFEDQVRGINDIVANDSEKSRMKVNFTDLLRSIGVCGTAIGKVGYELQVDTVMVKERGQVSLVQRALAMMSGRPAPVPMDSYTPKEMKVKDWATCDYRDLYKIYPEPFTTKISKDHWIIEESRITNRELVEGANSQDPYTRLKNVSADLLMSTSNREQEDPETQIRRMALDQRSTSMFYFDPDMPHTLDEFWGPVPIWMVDPSQRDNPDSKYKMVNAWIWVIDGSHCVRSVLCPYRDGEPPYVKFEYIRVPGVWWGIGPAELMMGLQIEKNEVVNTGSDQTNLSLNKVIAVIKDKVNKDDWQRLKSQPGGLWLFENIQRVSDAFQIIDFPDIGRDWYMKINMIDQAIQETTAANKSTVGAGGGGDQAGGDTFRGQLLNKQTSSERFMMYARTLESLGIADIYKKMYQRVYQFKSYESVANVLGQERAQKFEFLPPEQLEMAASLVPLGVMTMETKGVKLAQMGEWVKLFGSQPWAKLYEIARRMWIEMGYSDPDIVTFSEEEMDQFNQFKRQLLSEMPPGMGTNGSPGGPAAGGTAPAPGSAPSPIAGNTPGPTDGMPRPPMPARGPGASSIDLSGRPMS